VQAAIVPPLNANETRAFMSEESIFHEIEEELRSDRMRAFWKAWGIWVIAAAVGVVLVVAGYQGWTWWRNTVSSQASDEYYTALDAASSGNIADAQKALNDVIATGAGGYPTLARFRQASLLAKDGKTKQAVQAYDALSGTLKDKNLREVALVMAAYLLVDEGDVAGIQSRVDGLITPADPMRNAAREAIGLAQYKAGKLDDALKTFKEIAADPQTPRDMQMRVAIYSGQLVAEGAKLPATPAPADQSGATSGSSGSPAASGATPGADAGGTGATPSSNATAPASGK
jgi:hypothetical protein